MSYYYKMNFVSPEPLYAKIKETMRSYFESGAVDDLMFPIWTQNCLDKFYNSTYKIENVVLDIKDFESPLPEDFKSLREAWLCTNVWKSMQAPSSFYYQKDVRVSALDDACNELDVPVLSCDPCEAKYRVTNKVNNEVLMTFDITLLLKPGNTNASSNCDKGCPNLNSTALDTFDIADCKFITNFSEGSVYMNYYSKTIDEDGDRLIPDNIRVQNYIENYIMYKLFEFLWHQVSDESSRQVENKMIYYKAESDKAQIIADVELKKETVWQKNQRIIETKNRFRNYRIR